MKFYKAKGIQREAPVAYSPQLNEVTERFNRALVEKVSMPKNSRIPKFMSGEAVQTGTFLINRSPTAALPNNLTPTKC